MIKNKSNKIIIITISTLFLLLVTLLITKSIKTHYEIKSINEKIDIVNKNEVFEIWVIDGGLSYVLDEIVEEYRVKYPDINFVIKSFSERIYYQTILAAAATNSLPDMFYTWGDAELKELVKLGIVEDITLTVGFRNIEQSMVKGALNGYTFDDKIYGIPVFGWNLVMYCNKKLFDDVDLEYPSDYEELVEAINKFKSYGITPIAISGEDAWTQSMYYMAFALEDGSVKENINISKDASAFNNIQFKEAAKKLENISKLNPWVEGYTNINAPESVDKFLYEDCAMLLSGSWVSSSIDGNDYGLNENDVDVVGFSKKPYVGIASYSDGFVLSKKDKEDKSYELMYTELMRQISDYAVLKKGIGLPVYQNQNLEGTDYEMLKKCNDLFPQVRHSAYDRILPSKRKDIYNMTIKELVRGNINSDQFIETINNE